MILACWATIVVYCVLSIVAGPSGVNAVKAAEVHAAAMAENLRKLEARHEELALELNALRSSTEAVAIESRSLGYVAEGETLVVLQALSVKPPPAPDPGVVVERAARSPLSDSSIKLISMGVAAAACSAFYILRRLSRASSSGRQRESLDQAASRT